MPILVAPTERYKASFLDAVREAQATGSGLGDTLTWNVGEAEADFGAFLATLRRFEPPADLPEGFVHSEVRWLVDGDTYLGRTKIRHTLNDRLREFGGHIGYELRPSARGQGYGKLILALALDRARELGLPRVLLTCDVENLGSRGVIEANGGECEGEFRLAFYEKPIRRYWIELDRS
ncbi:GNAT family N-acetyltransferase [Deinococcus metallilatus]|uniref:Acetyltransferase n=1 Tax=Deinococcus metallilatus TaxID=1211322 RepID=A0AAJ5F3X1_9DEIO|nr:GNAT family N-acetyltransferase [Deinococcus metallilatus]MBB5294747.1 putative acetyltransferase [Deinococcus metallilatus]QBY09524.1 GNAT family N-acetyltransferase [Deinococcus metallilatus]RXJ09529.1 GNAT family N-acetyltransferase [Deinococcus metallilatus]TLK29051.1 GNAT family N-acetyltransferase [Deinococcus metallilatus]